MSQAVTDLLDLPIADIITSGRHRLDNGDIPGLAASIAQLGLLQPIGVTPDQGGYRLVFGRRRILAHEQLGRTHILARVVNVPAIVLAEHAENEIRKDFTVSERVAIGRAVEEELRAAGERRGRPKQAHAGQTPLLGEIVEILPQFDLPESGQKTRELAAQKAGFGSDKTYRDAKAVVEQATPELVAAVDQGTVAISTAAKLATAPVEVQRQAATDPKQAIELAKATSAAKVKEIRETAKEEQQIKTAQRREERQQAAMSIETELPQQPSKPNLVKVGDWWQLGRHSLYCGDTSKPAFYQDLPRVDFAFADPPYGANVATWDASFYWEHDWLIQKAPIVAVTPGIISVFNFAKQTTMPYRWSMAAWVTNGMTRGAIGFGNWIYIALFAPLEFSLFQQAQDVIRCSINLQETAETDHKGRKPAELMIALLNLYCKDTVLDPFLGSGTTLLAAEKIGKTCVGGELSPEYCQVIIERWEQMTHAKAVKRGK